jgi:hypothetical protein
MDAASKPGEDGLPIFNLFVRTKAKNVRMYIYDLLPYLLAYLRIWLLDWEDTNLNFGCVL